MQRPKMVTMNINKRLLMFHSDYSYQCDVCKQCISTDENFISGFHTHTVHPGNLRYSKIDEEIHFDNIFEISDKLE